MAQDSPLSIAANLTGILTFVFAVVAGFYARAISLRNAIDTQAEVSSALEKIDFLETETDMLNNAYLASQIRHPDRSYGNGDFKYFQGLYAQSLDRMRRMDRELRKNAALVTGGSRMYVNMSRVKTATQWMSSRSQIHKAIEERKAESNRIFQIQLAMLSAKIDELSWHQNHHNTSCSTVVEEIGSLHSAVETRLYSIPSFPPALSAASSPDGKSLSDEILAISIPAEPKPLLSDRSLRLKKEKDIQTKDVSETHIKS